MSRRLGKPELEEFLLLIRDRNRDKKVEAECCIRVEPDGIVLSIWDSGEIFDITDGDILPGGLREYVASTLLRQQVSGKHMVATSFNRNIFRFPLDDVRN